MATTADDNRDGEESGYDEIPPHKREQALKRDNYTCQLDGTKGIPVGGDMPIQVHHKQDDPEDCGQHDLPNLITLCIHCHYWHHSRPTADLPSVEITQQAAVKLKPVDFQLIYLFEQEGPLKTGEIENRIRTNKCRNAIEECLWRVMGVDNLVEEQQQILDRNPDTDEWGFPQQITKSERRLPSSVDESVRRTIDKLIVQARDRGCDNKTISEVLGVSDRTINRSDHRGRAYDFSLDDYMGRGRPRKESFETDCQSPTDGGVPDNQQHLDELRGDTAVNDDSPDDTGTGTDVDAADEVSAEADTAGADTGVDADAGDNDTRTAGADGDRDGDDGDLADAGGGVTADADVEDNAAGANRDHDDCGDVDAGRRRGWCHKR